MRHLGGRLGADLDSISRVARRAPKRSSRTIVALVAVGVLVGLSACGSDSSSASKGSASKQSSGSTTTEPGSPAVKKEAGLFGLNTRLEVVNMDTWGATVQISADGTCHEPARLAVGESDATVGENLSGTIHFGPQFYGHGDDQGLQANFSAYNPDVGHPYIRVTGLNSYGSTSRLPQDLTFNLAEGESLKTARAYCGDSAAERGPTGDAYCWPSGDPEFVSFMLVATRGADSDYKMLSLTIFNCNADRARCDAMPGSEIG